jgi:hypothetical protein
VVDLRVGRMQGTHSEHDGIGADEGKVAGIIQVNWMGDTSMYEASREFIL